MTTNNLDHLTTVHIEQSGRFKYILIKVFEPLDEEDQKFIIRGYAGCKFHADIYDKVTPKIYELGLDCECLGGGRIRHVPEEKKIEVFGYSQGYGKADHTKTVELLREKFQDYKSIAVID